VLATGGGAMQGSRAGHVHVIDGAPHDRLFPLMSACVHHGGAGTTAAALRAGKPQVICPFFGDQPFWARQVEKLGAGPTALDVRSLTANNLAKAIAAVVNTAGYTERAEGIGRSIWAEDGVKRAIAFLEARALLA
jgi:sterol 3beta-glucosyltransferase